MKHEIKIEKNNNDKDYTLSANLSDSQIIIIREALEIHYSVGAHEICMLLEKAIKNCKNCKSLIYRSQIRGVVQTIAEQETNDDKNDLSSWSDIIMNRKD